MKKIILGLIFTIEVLQGVVVEFTKTTTAQKYDLSSGEKREYDRLKNRYDSIKRKSGENSPEAAAAFLALAKFFDGLQPMEEESDEELDYDQMFKTSSDDEDAAMFGPTSVAVDEEDPDSRDRRIDLMLKRQTLEKQLRALQDEGESSPRAQNASAALHRAIKEVMKELQELSSSAAQSTTPPMPEPIDLGEEPGVRAPIAPQMDRLVGPQEAAVNFDDDPELYLALQESGYDYRMNQTGDNEDAELVAALELSRQAY